MEVDAVWEPRRFRFGDMVKGDEFMLATDAARLLGKTMQQLFQMFPGLMRRQALPAERAILQDRGILRRACNLATLVYAREIDLLVTGNEQAHALRLHPELVKKPVRGAMYELVHASHVPQAAPCTHTRLASRFTNVLAPNFRRKYGMASKSDELPVRLAPIRLSLDYEQQRIREIFCWNLSDTSVPMVQFAQQLCRDLEVTEEFVPLIVESIEGQIIEFTTVAQVPIPPRLATIHLELQFGTMLFVDQFLWSHDEAYITPEQFATQLCAEIGLGMELGTVIAHAIREQLFFDRKMALAEEHTVDAMSGVRTHADLFRPREEVLHWSPALATLSDLELEKRENAEDRESRRRRRTTTRTVEEKKQKKNRRKSVSGVLGSPLGARSPLTATAPGTVAAAAQVQQREQT